MNLLVKKLKVLALVVLMPLLFISCEDPTKIGLNINPSKGTVLTKYKEFVLSSSQVQFNPRSTTKSSSIQAGSYYDSDFGMISSKTYTWLGVQTTTPILNVNAAYDSISISIQFSSIYGSEAINNEVVSFDVYQLGEEIVPSTEYTRVDELTLGQPLGTLDIFLQANDTLRSDSVFTFSLDDAFGQSLFDKLKANDGTYDNDTVFNSLFKGIAIIPNSSNNKIIQFSSTSFAVKLYYHEVNASGDDVSRTYRFDLGNTGFYHLDSELGGTPLSGIMPNNTDFTPSTNFRYLQSGTMIGLKLDYSNLFNFLDSVQSDPANSIIVQQAFLTVGDIAENMPGQDYPFNLVGYFTDGNNTWPAQTEQSYDSSNVFVTLQTDLAPFDNITLPMSAGDYYSTQEIGLDQTNLNTYKASMSTFIQNMFNGSFNTNETPLESRGEIILFPPSSLSEPQSTPSHVLTHHFKVHKDSIKLTLYYSISDL